MWNNTVSEEIHYKLPCNAPKNLERKFSCQKWFIFQKLAHERTYLSLILKEYILTSKNPEFMKNYLFWILEIIFDRKIFFLDFLAHCMEVYSEFLLGRSKSKMATSWEHMTLWQMRIYIYILHINYWVIKVLMQAYANVGRNGAASPLLTASIDVSSDDCWSLKHLINVYNDGCLTETVLFHIRW
jgi:hypothetical protein